jgi:hypothetical protein
MSKASALIDKVKIFADEASAAGTADPEIIRPALAALRLAVQEIFTVAQSEHDEARDIIYSQIEEINSCVDTFPCQAACVAPVFPIRPSGCAEFNTYSREAWTQMLEITSSGRFNEAPGTGPDGAICTGYEGHCSQQGSEELLAIVARMRDFLTAHEANLESKGATCRSECDSHAEDVCEADQVRLRYEECACQQIHDVGMRDMCFAHESDMLRAECERIHDVDPFLLRMGTGDVTLTTGPAQTCLLGKQVECMLDQIDQAVTDRRPMVNQTLDRCNPEELWADDAIRSTCDYTIDCTPPDQPETCPEIPGEQPQCTEQHAALAAASHGYWRDGNSHPLGSEQLHPVSVAKAPGMRGGPGMRVADGITSWQNPSSWTQHPTIDFNSCGQSSYITFDLGEVRDVSQVTIWGYGRPNDRRRYCNVKVALSETGAFAGEEDVKYDSGNDWSDAESAEGKAIQFSATRARYVRHWRGRSTANTGVHFMEMSVFGPSATPMLSASGEPIWRRVAENICFSATDRAGASFPVTGPMNGVKLEHVSGFVSCRRQESGNSNWGCDGAGPNLVTLIVDDSGNRIYPMANPLLTHVSPHGSSYQYTGFNAMSPELELHGDYVANGELTIVYGEALTGHTVSDNRGESCVNVYVLQQPQRASED